MLRHLALLTVAVSAVGAVLAGAHEDATGDQATPQGTTATFSCGGYDADGNVVNERAAAIGQFEAAGPAPIDVPDVCGGYTADGVYIGDD